MGQTIPKFDVSIRDVPIIGDWIGQVGKIRVLAGQKCEPGAYVTAFAYWHATPFLVWSLFAPDCIDLVDDRRGRGHRSRRVVRWRNAHGIVGSGGSGGGFGSRVFWLGDLAQRAGWYMGIIDATLDLTVYASSLAYQFSGCEGIGPYAFFSNENTPHNLFATGTPLPLGWGEHEGSTFIDGVNDCIIPAGFSWSSMLSWQAAAFDPSLGLPNVRVIITDIISGATVFDGTGDPDGDGIFVNGGGFSEGNPFLPLTHLDMTYTASRRAVLTGQWRVGGMGHGDLGLIPTGCGSIQKKNGSYEGWWSDWVEKNFPI